MKVKLLTPTAQLPKRGSPLAAGYDLFSDNDEVQHIINGTPVSISTGIAVRSPMVSWVLLNLVAVLRLKKVLTTWQV